MRKSHHITLTLLSAAMLASGCGRSSPPVPNRIFYDANKQVVPREQWLEQDGKPVPLFDEYGNPVAPQDITAAYSTNNTSRSTTNYRRTSPWWGPIWWSSGPSYYGGNSRPTGSNNSSGTRSPGSTYYGGSKPNTTAPATGGSQSSTSGNSARTGGFGSTGSHASAAS